MGGYGADYSYEDDEVVTRKSAKAYNIASKRSYKTENFVKLPPPRDKVLITKALLPVVISVDVTGSMSTYPKMIFEKLCILYNEALFFLPKDLKKSFEISFAANGDSYDSYPLQVTDFAKGHDLDLNINTIYPEGGGGGLKGGHEMYEMMAYYYSKHCNMPKAMSEPKPLFFFVCDENYYDVVNSDQIRRLIGLAPQQKVHSKDVFVALREKFEVYNLRIRYTSGQEEKKIIRDWENAVGINHVALLDPPQRVVDVILAIIANHTGQLESYIERLKVRQTSAQVVKVGAILKGIGIKHKGFAKAKKKASTKKKKTSKKKTSKKKTSIKKKKISKKK
jgi:hypothetical protein